MKGKITVLPGTRCRYYAQGHCFFKEAVNPGLHLEFRCVVLNRWEAEYERFLTQADAFNLSIRTAVGIWERRFHEMMSKGPICKDYSPKKNGCCTGPELDKDEINRILGCAFYREGTCIKKLPDCSGMCSDYSPDSGPEECPV